MPPLFFDVLTLFRQSHFLFRGVTRGVIEENCSKFQKIKIQKKFREPLILLGSRNFFGGDNRDRTGDLLNAIQRKVVVAQRFFGLLVVTWWS